MLATAILVILFPLFFISNAHICPDGQLPCGHGYVCYDPVKHSCSKDYYMFHCPHLCGHQCYNKTTSYCFNDTLVCGLKQKVCAILDFLDRPAFECYDPSYQVCATQTVCNTSTLCDKKCLRGSEVCIDNSTICPTHPMEWLIASLVQLCNGTCYRTTVQICVNESKIQCAASCSGRCYNASQSICVNNTFVCSSTSKTCEVWYDVNTRQPFSSPALYCYEPAYQICLNRTMCHSSVVCGTTRPQCLGNTDVCINNNRTICHGFSRYAFEFTSPVKLCNGICYDSTVLTCSSNGTVTCASPGSFMCDGNVTNEYARCCPTNTRCSGHARSHYCIAIYSNSCTRTVTMSLALLFVSIVSELLRRIET